MTSHARKGHTMKRTAVVLGIAAAMGVFAAPAVGSPGKSDGSPVLGRGASRSRSFDRVQQPLWPDAVQVRRQRAVDGVAGHRHRRRAAQGKGGAAGSLSCAPASAVATIDGVKVIGTIVVVVLVAMGVATYLVTRPATNELDAQGRAWVDRYEDWGDTTERQVDRAISGMDFDTNEENGRRHRAAAQVSRHLRPAR